MNVGDRGQLLRAEGTDEPRPVEVPLRLDHVAAVCAPADLASGAERGDEVRHGTGYGDERLAERRDRIRAVEIQERLDVTQREEIPAFVGFRRHVLDDQDPGGGLQLSR
jgi:hypothetical protein